MSAVCSLPSASAAVTAGGVLFALLGGILAAFTLYHVTVAVAAFFYRPDGGAGAASRPAAPSRLVVLVPAHDEAGLIARCVRSLKAQTYPSDLYDVVVVADNCTDDTAAIAKSAGADVLVRNEPNARGKGRALRWAIDQVLAHEPEPDGIVVVDADSVAVPEFLSALVQPFERGAAAVQGESLLTEDGSAPAALGAAAFLLINRVRPAGLSVLGLPSNLAGNGMLFSRDLLRAHPWDAFTSAEDVEYSMKLRMAGVGPAFAGGAILHSPTAPSTEAAVHQQLRWEGGKYHVARTYIPRLVAAALRERRPSLLGAAFELALLPLGLLAGAAAAGATVGTVLVSTGVLPPWSLAPWLVALAGIPLYVLLGLRAAGAPRSAYRALARAPVYVVRKMIQAHRLFAFRADSWVRTDRAPPDRD